MSDVDRHRRRGPRRPSSRGPRSSSSPTRTSFPHAFRVALAFVPAAVLAAIVVPGLAMPQGVLRPVARQSALVAGLAAVAVAAKVRQSARAHRDRHGRALGPSGADRLMRVRLGGSAAAKMVAFPATGPPSRHGRIPAQQPCARRALRRERRAPRLARDLAASRAAANSVGTLEATRLMNQPGSLVLDVREGAEFATGHLPRARHIPLGELGQARRRDREVQGKAGGRHLPQRRRAPARPAGRSGRPGSPTSTISRAASRPGSRRAFRWSS